MQSATETKNFAVIYTGVNRYTRDQSGVTIWVHKSISQNIEYYKFLNDRLIEIRLNEHKGVSTILGVYVITERRKN